MASEPHQEYDDDLTEVLAAIWGEGFLSPGGTAEVDRVLHGLDMADKEVLDIGCGTGGMAVHITRSHGVGHITGIDVDASLITKCRALANKHRVADRASFELVSPGPLPFEDCQFDVVTSKDSIIHIPDKAALAADVFRVLRPGGFFAASDWLAGYEGEPSPEMQAYVDAEGLGFGLASAHTYRQAMIAAGFLDVKLTDRNEWYRVVARTERDRLRGQLYDGLSAKVNSQFLDHEIEVWNLMIVALDQGQLRPTHLRGLKPY
ncbi:MAG: SAM-dependent methyltransferase [Lysobacterales bacterium]|jgi:SAM-dependent methyltransferase